MLLGLGRATTWRPRLPAVPTPSTRLATALRLALTGGALLIVGLRVLEIVQGSSGIDAHAYWAADAAHPYGAAYETRDAYLYSPAFLQLLTPLRLLPYEAFFVAWTLLATGVLLWLVGPIWAAALLIPGSFSPVYHDLWFGNVMILMSAALVVGFRYSGSWAFMLLTKVTPGIGLLWFAVRREWRALAVAAAVTAAIALISFVLAPQLWVEWFGSLRSNAATPEVQGWSIGSWPLRLGMAGLLIALGARLNARWVLPIALFLAQPVTWFIGFTLGTAWIGMHRHRAWLARAGAEA